MTLTCIPFIKRGLCLLPLILAVLFFVISQVQAGDLSQEGMLKPPSELSGSEGALSPAGTDQTNASIFSAPVDAAGEIVWNPYWPYADRSVLHTGKAKLYRSPGSNGIIVCVNAGHGTQGGEQHQTLSHPDGSGKVTGGTNAQGAVYSMSVSSGTTMSDGTTEAAATLRLAKKVKDRLLSSGYDVLMIREDEDTQLDNIARTVIANAWASCHLALHYDSTATDKGFFYIGVPEDATYRSMEPVASHWQEHEALGQSILSGMREAGIPLYQDGRMPMDLTQISYSTIPSLDLECGDQASDLSDTTLDLLAEGILRGLNDYYQLGS